VLDFPLGELVKAVCHVLPFLTCLWCGTLFIFLLLKDPCPVCSSRPPDDIEIPSIEDKNVVLPELEEDILESDITWTVFYDKVPRVMSMWKRRSRYNG
jgi:hypothetical protein